MRGKKTKQIKEALILLQSISKLKPYDRPILLAHLDEKGIDAISNLVFNLLYNKNIKFTPKKRKQIKQLLKQRINDYRKLAEKRRSFISKKRIVKQHGGFIGALLGATIPLIADLIAKYV